jgi:short-subunit dehydrogenase
MKPRLKPIADQVIVITGASSGSGLATAREAARRGASVVLVARNARALQKIEDELRNAGCRAAICTADVGKPRSAERIAQTAI